MKPNDYFFHKYSLYLLHKPVNFFFYEATKAENHKTLLISFVDRKTRVWGQIHRSPYLDWWQYFCDAADSNNMKDHISNMNLSSNDIPRPCEQKEWNINHCLFVCLQRYLIRHTRVTAGSQTCARGRFVWPPPKYWLICYILAVRPNQTRPECTACVCALPSTRAKVKGLKKKRQ